MDYEGIGESMVALSKFVMWVVVPLAVVGLCAIAAGIYWLISMIQLTWKG